MKANRKRMLVWLGLVWLLILVLQPVVAQRAGAAQGTGELDVATLDAFVREQVERQGIPGLALAVVDGERIVHMAGYGEADGSGRPVTPQTPFVLASVSKPITALAVMQLVEAGTLELDAPVQRYLPDFRVADPVASRQITLRQLLQHTSGVPEWGCITRTGAKTLEQFVAEWQTIELHAAPGEKYHYCSGNYNVLGRVIEVVTGQSFGAYIERQLFAPLAMDHSHTTLEEARSDGLTQRHQMLFGVSLPREYEQPSALPAGFLISSAEDMGHFLIAQLNGGRFGDTRVLSPAGIAASHAPGAPMGAGKTYGLGWATSEIDGEPVIYHDGGHWNAHARLFLQPRTGRGAVILVNMNNFTVANFGPFPELETGVFQLLAGKAPAAPGWSLPSIYLVLNTVMAGTIALVFWPLLRLHAWAQRLGPQPARRRKVWATVRVVWEIGAGLVLLFGSRLLSDALLGTMTWAEVFQGFPDLALWIWTLSLLGALTGALRLMVLIRALRNTRGEQANAAALPRQGRA